MYWLLFHCLISAQISDHMPSCTSQKTGTLPWPSTLALLSLYTSLHNLSSNSIGSTLNLSWNFSISSANAMVWATIISGLYHWESHWLAFNCPLAPFPFILHVAARMFLKYWSKHATHFPAQNLSIADNYTWDKSQILALAFECLHDGSCASGTAAWAPPHPPLCIGALWAFLSSFSNRPFPPAITAGHGLGRLFAQLCTGRILPQPPVPT